jgi:hypothetical protein
MLLQSLHSAPNCARVYLTYERVQELSEHWLQSLTLFMILTDPIGFGANLP